MSIYLEFRDLEDKEYSFKSVDDNYSLMTSAAKALFGKPSDKLKYSTKYNRVKKAEGKYRKANALDKLKERFKENNKKDKASNIESLRKIVKEKTKERKAKGFLTSLEKEAKKKRIEKFKDNAKKVAVTGTGAVLGAKAGSAAMKKYKTKLASLNSKSEKTEKDLKDIKSLKRKITAAKLIGGTAGAVLGNKVAKKL